MHPIPAGKSELEPNARKSLEAFRKKVGVHHCKYWKDVGELKSQVLVALTNVASEALKVSSNAMRLFILSSTIRI